MVPSPSRLSSLVRLLLQLRALLTLVALVLLLPGTLHLPTALSITGYVALTLIVAYFWDQCAPYLRRHPVLVTADILCSTGILLLAGPTSTFFFGTVITATVTGVLFGSRGVALVSALLIVGYTGSIGANYAPPVVTVQALIVNPLLYPVAGFIGIRLRGVLTELAAAQSAREAAERSAAAAEERAKLARDMHDSVAKTLRGTAMAAQALPMWVTKDPERALATAQQVAEAAEIASNEARRLIDGLRHKSPMIPLDQAVRDQATALSDQTRLTVDIEGVESGIELDAPARHELLAILGETLTNVERHAHATTIQVALSARNQHAILSVKDDGHGFDPNDTPTGHYGLIGMTERAKRAGGTLEVESAPDNGTAVVLKLPLPTAAPASPVGGAP